MYIVVAEKPRVAKAIRSALRSINVDAVVDSTRGHVLDVDVPKGYGWGEVDPYELLRLGRRDLRRRVRDRKTHTRLRNLFKKYNGTLVIATDNDPEGELIGYEILRIYERVNGRSRYLRMRFNSIDRMELIRAWKNLEGSLNWRWVYKAMFRQGFDLITGAAFSRFLTMAAREGAKVKLISWGSCQTPTLYFVVQREREREAFVPRDFWYLEARAVINGKEVLLRTERAFDKGLAKSWMERARESRFGVVTRYGEEDKVIHRPYPLRTDDLLRDVVRLTNADASKVLNIAEELYSEGYITYPRTETNIWPDGVKFEIIRSRIIRPNDRLFDVSKYINARPEPRNGRKSDKAHPPIYPLKIYSKGGLMRFVWEYVARRFLANVFCDDAVITNQDLVVDVNGVAFSAQGRFISRPGFYHVFNYFVPSQYRIPRARQGDRVEIMEVSMKHGRTRPPSRLTESELLRMMEASRIGTDATRARYPRLISIRGYAVKKSGRFRPTILGRALIDLLEEIDPDLVTPGTRRYVENLMSMIEDGRVSIDDAFSDAVRRYRELYERCSRHREKISMMLADAINGGRRRSGRPR